MHSKNNFKVDFWSTAIFYWPFSSVIDRDRNRPFNLIQNKVGYRSCFATGVKLEHFYETVLTLNTFWRWFTANLIVHWVRRGFFSNPQWNFICCYTKLCFNIFPTIHKKYRKQNKQPNRKLVRQIILEINSLDM
jgi:hypothetical protein